MLKFKDLEIEDRFHIIVNDAVRVYSKRSETTARSEYSNDLSEIDGNLEVYPILDERDRGDA